MSGQATIPTIEQQDLSIFQINAEGLTIAKLDIILHLANSHKVAAILLQEIHYGKEDTLKLPQFNLAGSILSKQHGIVMVEWISMTVNATLVVNVYKPPPSPLSTSWHLPSMQGILTPAHGLARIEDTPAQHQS